MNNLWVATKLEHVCGFQNGFAFKSSTFKPTGIPIIRISNIQDDTIDVDNRLVFFDPKDYDENLDRYRVVEGDLVIAMSGATTGKIGFNTENIVFYLNQRVGKFEPGKNLVKRFLYYYLSMNVEENLRISAGAAQPNLSTEQIKSFVIPLPPLPEQYRIVAILDEAFEAIATAKANAEKNLQNARAVFESYLESVFTERGTGWVETRLADICERVSVGHVGPTSEFYCEPSEGIPFLRSQNVRPGKLDWDGIQYVTKEFHSRLRKSQIRFGDLLFVRVGANRGDCCAVLEDVAELNCANIVFARPTRGNAAYLERYCQSPSGRGQLLGMTTGSAQGVINTSSVAALIVPLPKASEQEKIVNKLDEFYHQTQTLTQIYQRKLIALDELKKSLLHQAFSGAL